MDRQYIAIVILLSAQVHHLVIIIKVLFENDLIFCDENWKCDINLCVVTTYVIINLLICISDYVKLLGLTFTLLKLVLHVQFCLLSGINYRI